ncbi:Aminodeoxychorismate lyase [Nakaseomyces bracarensis]|uniref:Aminodeoxychorismate lyase n=1 Tax=Nakaseomyces bracarensis TaxID=273131 RepID=A0ABR4NRM3_9SACH
MNYSLHLDDDITEQFQLATGVDKDFLQTKHDELKSTELLSTMRYDPGFTNSEGKPIQVPVHLFSTFDSLEEQNIQKQLPQWFDESGFTSHSLQMIPHILTKLIENPIELNMVHDIYQVYYYRFLLLGEQFMRLKVSSYILKRSFKLTLTEFIDGLVNAIYNTYNTDTVEMDTLEKMQYLLDKKEIYKMRVLFKANNSLEFQAHRLENCKADIINTEYFIKSILSPLTSPISTKTEEIWDVFIDTEPIETSAFTSLKSTNRSHYTAARNRMDEMKRILGIVGKTEILVWNKHRQLMEGSITNVAIPNKDNKLMSPGLNSGCLCGTMRYYLIQKGFIVSHDISVDDLKDGESILLFNGVMGIVKGRIHKKTT